MESKRVATPRANRSAKLNRTNATQEYGETYNGDFRFFQLSGDYDDTLYKQLPSNERVGKCCSSEHWSLT